MRFFGDAIRPETIMAWVISPNPKRPDLNGLYDGATATFRPAFDVYTRYILAQGNIPQSPRLPDGPVGSNPQSAHK